MTKARSRRWDFDPAFKAELEEHCIEAGLHPVDYIQRCVRFMMYNRIPVTLDLKVVLDSYRASKLAPNMDTKSFGDFLWEISKRRRRL